MQQKNVKKITDTNFNRFWNSWARSENSGNDTENERPETGSGVVLITLHWMTTALMPFFFFACSLLLCSAKLQVPSAVETLRYIYIIQLQYTNSLTWKRRTIWHSAWMLLNIGRKKNETRLVYLIPTMTKERIQPLVFFCIRNRELPILGIKPFKVRMFQYGFFVSYLCLFISIWFSKNRK